MASLLSPSPGARRDAAPRTGAYKPAHPTPSMDRATVQGEQPSFLHQRFAGRSTRHSELPSSRFPCPVPFGAPDREVAGSQPCTGRTLRDSRLFPALSLPIPPGTPSPAAGTSLRPGSSLLPALPR